MKTTFSTLELDRLRYSQVWEDSRVIEHILKVDAEDEVLVVTSGGSNVFNTLLFGPKKVYAVDLNPVQNEFLALQIFIIRQLQADDYLSAMGYKGKQRYQEIRELVEKLASPSQWKIWSRFFSSSEEGLALSGKLESYITYFYDTLSARPQSILKELFKVKHLDEQHLKLQALLDLGFDQDFIDYFDRANLSKGRDIGLYKHTASTGGELFFQRFLDFAQSNLLRDNFIANFFFFGPAGVQPGAIPRFCKANHYLKVRERLDRIEYVGAEAIDFLTSSKGAAVSKAVLSNIFEYVSKEEFNKAIVAMTEREGKDLQFLFWNLLNDQGSERIYHSFQEEDLNEQAKELESCFYFGSVHYFDLSK
jgi:S-adenosylmethionine-diacylglycerol 3-amino-3-carboxypropyl transferase